MLKENQGKLQCGLIGLGRFGQNYLRLLQNIEGAVLRATANHSNVADIFSDPLIEAIFIVTPPSTHFELIEKGLRAGKHVFTEKPMVLSTDDTEKLKTLVGQSGKTFMVGFQYLFNENIRHIKREIESGAFGNILSVKSEHVLSPSRSDIDIFWDAAPHPLSVFQFVFKPKKLLAVEGKIEHEKASVRIYFENVPTLEIAASSFGDEKVRKLKIVGEKAAAVLDETLECNKLAVLEKGKIFYPEIKSVETLRAEIEHFIHCIKTGETPLADIGFGSQITEWLETVSKKLAK